MSKDDKYTLITNLSYVTIGQVRTQTHALLVCTSDGLFDRGAKRCQLRGFSTEASTPTFDCIIPTIEFDLVDAESRDVFLGEEGARPLCSGAIMRIQDFPEIQLITMNHRTPLDVHRFADGTDINDVWEFLVRRVAQHWTAPNMPLAEWRRASLVRSLLRIEPIGIGHL